METKVVGIVTDPDLPNEIANRLKDELPDVLASGVTDKVNWEVRVKCQPMPLDENGKIVIWRNSQKLKEDEGYDFLICLTELTRRLEGQLVLSDVNIDYDSALISLPALGPVRLRHHVKNGIVRVVRVMLDDDLQPEREAVKKHRPLRLSDRMQSPIRQETTNSEEGGTDSYLALEGFRGAMRLLFGMVRINRPWLLLPSLSSAIAAAAAAAAFGIFYASIWTMADSLVPGRLLLISVIAVAAMITWLIVYNGLWQESRHIGRDKDARVYNAATVLTLIVGVLCMYGLLLVVTFLGSLTVIPGAYFEDTLGHSITLLDYIELAWLASSMGTFAGALGSSFESDQAIMQATYGRREQERHERVSESQESGERDSDKQAGLAFRRVRSPARSNRRS
ncbi:hypothetical protein [Arthrobacter monumenti]